MDLVGDVASGSVQDLAMGWTRDLAWRRTLPLMRHARLPCVPGGRPMPPALRSRHLKGVDEPLSMTALKRQTDLHAMCIIAVVIESRGGLIGWRPGEGEVPGVGLQVLVKDRVTDLATDSVQELANGLGWGLGEGLAAGLGVRPGEALGDGLGVGLRKTL